jgi:hypothetical protein
MIYPFLFRELMTTWRPWKRLVNKKKQLRGHCWKFLLATTYSFCEEFGVPKLDVGEEYID